MLKLTLIICAGLQIYLNAMPRRPAAPRGMFDIAYVIDVAYRMQVVGKHISLQMMSPLANSLEMAATGVPRPHAHPHTHSNRSMMRIQL